MEQGGNRPRTNVPHPVQPYIDPRRGRPIYGAPGSPGATEGLPRVPGLSAGPDGGSDAPATAPFAGAAGPPAPGPWQPGKHLTLRVPNFNDAEDPDAQMTSYLRLGAVPDPTIVASLDAPRATGEDLAAYAGSFLDDERERDGCPDFIPPHERKAETAVLHTRGGWRDHSDGNRITTTRGDKVEVIRGNYQLIVLGRQGDPSGGAGWDVSGGHIEGLVARSAIQWVQTYDGTWKTVETSEKGDTDYTQHGDSVSRTYGDKIDSTTGSEDETRPVTDENGVEINRVFQANPIITDRTWARQIAYRTGSAGYRIPSILHETWAKRLTSKTVAGAMSDETTVDGVMRSTTTAGDIENTTIAETMSMVNLANMLNLNVGNNEMINVGTMENINLGATFDFTLAALVQLCLSGTLSINLGRRYDLNLASTTDLTPQKQEISAQTTVVTGAYLATAMTYKVVAAAIFLG